MGTPSIQSLLIQALANWYSQIDPSADHTRLLKILDVAQDLKVNTSSLFYFYKSPEAYIINIFLSHIEIECSIISLSLSLSPPFPFHPSLSRCYQ